MAAFDPPSNPTAYPVESPWTDPLGNRWYYTASKLKWALLGVTNIIDNTVIDGSTNPVSGNAVFDALAAKSDSKPGSVGRYAGMIAAGPPSVGTYLAGDWVHTATGVKWFCEASGTPGVWSSVDVVDPAALPGLTAGFEIGATVRSGVYVTEWTDISGNGYSAAPVYPEYKDRISALTPVRHAGGGSKYLPATPIPANFRRMTIVHIAYAGFEPPPGQLFASMPLGTPYDGGVLYRHGSVHLANPNRSTNLSFRSLGYNSTIVRFGANKTTTVTNGVWADSAVNNAALTPFNRIWGYTGPNEYGDNEGKSALFIFNRPITDGEIRGIEAFYGIRKATKVLIHMGDSFGQSEGATRYDLGYSVKLEGLTGRDMVRLCQGGANTAVHEMDQVVNTCQIAVTAGLDPVVIYALGNNDLAIGFSAAALQSALATKLAQIKATGVKLVMLTIPPRKSGFRNGATSASFETARNTVNAWIRTQTSLYTVLVDIAADPELGPQSASDGAFYADQCHPSNAGHAKYASLVGAAINSL